jgi:hypothetical protein
MVYGIYAQHKELAKPKIAENEKRESVLEIKLRMNIL